MSHPTLPNSTRITVTAVWARMSRTWRSIESVTARDTQAKPAPK
jgi:hypothetical protein